MKTWLTLGGLLLAAVGGLFLVFYMQVLAGDSIPSLVRARGLSLPLDDPWLEVSLQHMTLTLMDGEVFIKRYDIAYGLQEAGRLVERTSSTPLGEYRIISKEKNQDLFHRGTRFLRIDFPSEDDAARALDGGALSSEDYDRILQAQSLHAPPPTDTALKGPLGIQGNFFPIQQRRFTDGSLALSNGDINELYPYVPVGARVIIKPD